jgi:hypothetical protein
VRGDSFEEILLLRERKKKHAIKTKPLKYKYAIFLCRSSRVQLLQLDFFCMFVRCDQNHLGCDFRRVRFFVSLPNQLINVEQLSL